jgi:dUTP pyrophosphatase
LLHPDARVPTYALPGDAGCDLVAVTGCTIEPGERALIPTGIAVAIPEGFVGFVNPRSGLAAKHGITVTNAPGTIDSGYRGEVLVSLINLDPRASFEITAGMRIAQLVIVPVMSAVFNQVVELGNAQRGTDGFGSTGTDTK